MNIALNVPNSNLNKSMNLDGRMRSKTQAHGNYQKYQRDNGILKQYFYVFS